MDQQQVRPPQSRECEAGLRDQGTWTAEAREQQALEGALFCDMESALA